MLSFLCTFRRYWLPCKYSFRYQLVEHFESSSALFCLPALEIPYTISSLSCFQNHSSYFLSRSYDIALNQQKFHIGKLVWHPHVASVKFYAQLIWHELNEIKINYCIMQLCFMVKRSFYLVSSSYLYFLVDLCFVCVHVYILGRLMLAPRCLRNLRQTPKTDNKLQVLILE